MNSFDSIRTLNERELAQVLALRSALRLEILGMRKKGTSANTLACKFLRMPVRTRKPKTLDLLNTFLKERYGLL